MSSEQPTPSMPRRVPGSGLANRAPQITRPLSSPHRPAPTPLAARPAVAARPKIAAPIGGGRPSFNFKQFFKLSFTPEVPKQWRHLSVIALAALVATMSIDSKVLEVRPQVGGNYATSTTTTATRAQAVADVQLPEIKSVNLPPVPIKKEEAKEQNLQASNVVVVDDASRLPLYEKGANDKIAIASTTKIMTALVASNMYKDFDKVVDISNAAVNQIGSGVGFRPGETATIRQLLWGLLSVSGNDAALALSEQALPGGGPEATAAFVAKMNETAQRLGMKNTHFRDPAGLDDGGYSTPADMAKAMGELIKKPELVKIISTLNYEYRSAEGYLHQLTNSNRLIGEMYYDGIIGGKTGYTPKTAEGGAGHCLVVAATRNGHTLIAAVYDTYSQAPQASAEVARTALDYGFSNYTWQEIAR